MKDLGIFCLGMTVGIAIFTGGGYAYHSTTTFDVGQERMPIEGLSEIAEPTPLNKSHKD